MIKLHTPVLLALAFCSPASADVLLTEGTNISVDISVDGKAAIDLLGGIWVLPADGGEASEIDGGLRPAKGPRWSPDGNALVYQASSAVRDELWLHRVDDGSSQRLGDASSFDQQPSWHPDGDRIVFSSARHDSGFDIWEIDVATQLCWRLTRELGDETEPAWSMNGRDLLYVNEHAGQWSLMLRRRGQLAQSIATSTSPIAAPSWRPDGSLVTYMIESAGTWSVRMIILSEPRLDRAIIDGEDFFLAPVSWLDRQQMLYTANGRIRKRRFGAWTSVDVPFRAAVGNASTISNTPVARRELAAIDEPAGTTVIRAGRLFDGISNRYRNNPDIIIEGGRIVAIEEQRPRDGVIVVNLGDLTVLPGFVDAYASLPAATVAADGPLILGMGVTTLAVDHQDIDKLNAIWSGKRTPGPRMLSRHRLQTAGGTEEASPWQLVGTAAIPVSPLGRSYEDAQLATGNGAITLVSGLADNSTRGMEKLLRSRMAREIAIELSLTRRFAVKPDLSAAASTVVLGSAPNELPPGIALHAEFLALADAGLSPEQVLKAAGVNAAAALGLGLRLGRISTGAAADLVLVDGDPLADIEAALKIVGIVRNGRFFSVSGLVDRSKAAERSSNVE